MGLCGCYAHVSEESFLQIFSLMSWDPTTDDDDDDDEDDENKLILARVIVESTSLKRIELNGY